MQRWLTKFVGFSIFAASQHLAGRFLDAQRDCPTLLIARG